MIWRERRRESSRVAAADSSEEKREEAWHSATNCQRHFSSKLCLYEDLFVGILFNISLYFYRIDLVFSQSIFLYVVGLGVFHGAENNPPQRERDLKPWSAVQ